MAVEVMCGNDDDAEEIIMFGSETDVVGVMWENVDDGVIWVNVDVDDDVICGNDDVDC